MTGVALLPLLAGLQGSAGPGDTATAQPLAAVVVTVDRLPTPLARVAGSVALLGEADFRRRPARALADVLQQAPGVAFVDFDGMGRDPQLMARGFYGGGEADYAVLLVDGRPVQDQESGRAPWDLVPLSAVRAIEVVRGGASAAWGDAALAGVVNVITRRDGEAAPRIGVIGGSHGLVRGSAAASSRWNDRPVSLWGDASRLTGFRDHAGRRTASLGGSLGLRRRPAGSLSLFTRHDWRRFDEPGPLTGSQLAASRTRSADFYRFDGTDERRHELGLDFSPAPGAPRRFSAWVRGDYRRSDRTRALVLAPAFADTKHRHLTTARLAGSAQIELPGFLLPDRSMVLGGVDASLSRLSSRYFPVVQGPPEAYAAASGERGDLVASGTATRAVVAAVFQYAVEPIPALRLTLGGRLDGLHDAFDPGTPAGASGRGVTHLALSPRLGLNYRYASAGRQEGTVYLTAARSFKAPTPDQRFDQRAVPVPFPPFEITFANADLEPQYGASVEAGFSHRADLIPRTFSVALTGSASRMDLRNEIDFDLQALGFRNIGKSRHLGLEVGLHLYGPSALELFANYTRQTATARSGPNEGKALKALPRDVLTAGLSGARGSFDGSLLVTAARRMYLDDANTERLPNWARSDLRASYTRGSTRLVLDVFNLFDRAYSTTGFPDPSGSGEVYFYPAAGRSFQVGIDRGW